MADKTVLTSGAKFKCAHMPVPKELAVGGLAITGLSTKVRIGNDAAILDGAKITGFTPAVGCNFSDPSGPKPCTEFALKQGTATGDLSEDSKKAYTAGDLAQILLVPSSGNGLPGLVISDPQTKVRA